MDFRSGLRFPCRLSMGESTRFRGGSRGPEHAHDQLMGLEHRLCRQCPGFHPQYCMVPLSMSRNAPYFSHKKKDEFVQRYQILILLREAESQKIKVFWEGEPRLPYCIIAPAQKKEILIKVHSKLGESEARVRGSVWEMGYLSPASHQHHSGGASPGPHSSGTSPSDPKAGSRSSFLDFPYGGSRRGLRSEVRGQAQAWLHSLSPYG